MVVTLRDELTEKFAPVIDLFEDTEDWEEFKKSYGITKRVLPLEKLSRLETCIRSASM